MLCTTLFNSSWMSMKITLQEFIAKKSYITQLDRKLLDALNNRNDATFKNPLMSAALFLDPRFRSEITRNDCERDAVHDVLFKLKRRIDMLKEPQNAENLHEVSMNSSTGFDAGVQAAIDRYFSYSCEQSNLPDFQSILDSFEPERLALKNSVLEFWHSADIKEKYADLYEVAMGIYTIPPTEVQIERDFSALSFIFSDRRYNLLPKTLENIFLIHLNSDIYLKMNEDDINNLLI